MRNASHPEPFELVRRARTRETFASWYDRARMTLRSFVTLDSLPDDVVVRRPGEMSPATAGAITGAVGGAVMLAVATILARRSGRPLDVASLLGSLASGQRLFGTIAFAFGVAVALAIGAVVGAFFAWTTRRLRHFMPLLMFGVLLSPATWIVVHALALQRFAPWLAHLLPIMPMTIAAAVFGLVVSLELPLRTRRIV